MSWTPENRIANNIRLTVPAGGDLYKSRVYKTRMGLQRGRRNCEKRRSNVVTNKWQQINHFICVCVYVRVRVCIQVCILHVLATKSLVIITKKILV